MKPSRWAGWATDASGVAVVEFALIAPFLMLVGFAGYTIDEYCLVSRKVSLAAQTVARLASKYDTIESADMQTILYASELVVAPYPASPLLVRVSEVMTDPTGALSTVVWSKGLNSTSYLTGSLYDLPPDLRVAGGSLIVSEITYAYTPQISYVIAGPFQATERFFDLPRNGGAVRYTGG